MEVNGATTGRMAGYGTMAVADASTAAVTAGSQSAAVNTDVRGQTAGGQTADQGSQGPKMIDATEAEKITKALNQFMNEVNPNLHFKLHSETNTLMVQFVDEKNNKVVKEFPSHELLDVVGKIRDLVGSFLDKKV